MEIGNQIKQHRATLNLSQEELAGIISQYHAKNGRRGRRPLRNFM